MTKPIYRLFSTEGHVTGYYIGEIVSGAAVDIEDIWLPDGRRPKAGEPIPKGLILSPDYAQRINAKEAPYFLRIALQLGKDAEAAMADIPEKATMTKYGELTERQTEWADEEEAKERRFHGSALFKRFSE